jgi:hypothetical protein
MTFFPFFFFFQHPIDGVDGVKGIEKGSGLKLEVDLEINNRVFPFKSFVIHTLHTRDSNLSSIVGLVSCQT